MLGIQPDTFTSRYFLQAHGRKDLLKECQFKVLRKCQGKFDCLDHEILHIKSLKPNLNIQTDSIRAKLFVSFSLSFFHYTGSLLIIVLLVFIVCNFQIILS